MKTKYKKEQNHLILTDRRLQACGAGDVMYYQAEIVSVSDYYPFGMKIQKRSYSATSYRFGFNGKELDDEISGEGNSLDFGARIYDSRLGRWMAVDDLANSTPFFSSYSFAYNKPILLIDVNGFHGWPKTSDWSPEDIDKFGEFIHTEIDRITEKAIKQGLYQGAKCDQNKSPDICFDCADFAIAMLIRYAAINGKEVKITLVDGQTISSDNTNSFETIISDNKVGTVNINGKKDFERAARGFADAKSILNNLVLLCMDEEVRIGDVVDDEVHVQVVYSTDLIERNRWDGGLTYDLNVFQGTSEPEIPRRSTGNIDFRARWEVLDIERTVSDKNEIASRPSINLDTSKSDYLWSNSPSIE